MAEKNKTVKFLVNVGTNDLSKYSLPEAYQEGDIVDLPESSADLLIKDGLAVEYTAEVKKADEEAAKAAEEAAIAAALPAAAAAIATEKAKDAALAKLKSGKPSAHREAKEAPHK